MKALTLAISLMFLFLTNAASALDVDDPLMIGRWVQYTYKQPNGTPREYLAIEFQEHDAIFSMVCQYADGAELEAATSVPIQLHRIAKGHDYFDVPADVQVSTNVNGHVCDLNFEQGRVYYIADVGKYNGHRSLRILIHKYDKIMDFMLRK